MHPLETYIRELREIRSSGEAVPETSYYGALANLFNEVGKSLKPRVRCIINIRNRGAALINVTSEGQAAKVGFQGSPSIRVNGKDIDGRNYGHAYGCRIYQIGGKVTPLPTKEFIQAKLKELTQ